MKRSPLIILGVTLFVDMLGFGFILPLLPIYIQHFNGQPWVGGLLLASFSTMQFIFSPIWGSMSDRHGRRPMILMSLLGSAFSYFWFGAAGSLVVLFLARVASGILTAASIPTAQAYIADVTTPEKRSGGMAMLGASFGLGFAFGPVLGGVLSQHPILGISSLAMPAFCAATLALINFAFAFFLLPESHTDRTPTQVREGRLAVFSAMANAMRHPSIRAYLTVYAFATFAFAAVESSFSWLVLLRFDAVLTREAANLWHTYAQHPLAQLPSQFAKTLPHPVNWPVFAQTPFASLPHDLQRKLVEEVQTRIASIIYGIVGISILFVQIAVMGRGFARLGRKNLVIFGVLLLTLMLVGIALAPFIAVIAVLFLFVLGAVAVGGFTRRIGDKNLVVFGAFLLTLTLVGIAFAPSIAFLYLLAVLIAVGNGVMNPSLSSLITQAAGKQERGMLSGAQQGLGSLARIIAPPINNYLVGVQTAIPFLISSVLMFISFVLSLGLRVPEPGVESGDDDFSVPASEEPAAPSH